MKYSINLGRLATMSTASTVVTGMLRASPVTAYTLDWTRATLDSSDPNYIEWDTTTPELTNIYEFAPNYTNEVGELYVKVTVSTDPAGHESTNQGFGTTPGIYAGSVAQAGAGGFTDELLAFTNNNGNDAPDSITLTLEFFGDAAGATPTNVTDFNTTVTDLDAGINGQRQERIIVTGEDVATNLITPTFDVPTGSLVTTPPNTASDNEVIGFNSGITDEKGNVRVFFPGDVHQVSIALIAATEGTKNRNMFITDLAITPDLAPLTEVPFEFSPTTGIFLSIGIFGVTYCQKKS